MYQFLSSITSNLTRVLGKKTSKLIQQRYVNAILIMNSNISCFSGVEDRYKGITVDSKEENCPPQDFPDMLNESIKSWITNNKRGIWFKVATQQAEWVPILSKNGFDFHHANPGYVMMYRWLPENESNNIPSYAHTMIGVGAIVTNNHNQVLVIKEKYFITPHWKFPGGIVDPGEHLVAAAVREVKEETNIDTEFESFIALRHAHKTMFDCSDMYMVLSLKAINEDVRHCPREIQAVKWMDIKEFMSSEDVSELNKLFMQRYLDYKEKNIKIECREGIHQFLKKSYMCYSVVSTDDKSNSAS